MGNQELLCWSYIILPVPYLSVIDYRSVIFLSVVLNLNIGRLLVWKKNTDTPPIKLPGGQTRSY